MIAVKRQSIPFREKVKTKIKVSDFLISVVFIDAFIFLYIELLKCYSSKLAAIINVVPDFLNVIVIVLLFMRLKGNGFLVKHHMSSCFLVLFLLIVTITALFPSMSLISKYRRYRYILIGFTIYYICIHYMNRERWERFKSFLFATQILHTLLVTVQNLTIHPGADRTNGIFGFVGYNNAVNGVFCLAMAIIGMEEFLNSKRRIQAAAKIFMSCYVCALAEIKAYYVMFLMSAFFVFILNHKDIKTLKRMRFLILLILAAIMLALVILFILMPDNLYALKSLEQWKAYESYETGRADGMGRITQIQWIYKNIFHEEFLPALFGMGLGADTSVAPYEIGKLFWNFGLIGLCVFLLFLIAKAVEMFKTRKRSQEAMICMVMCILTIPCMVVWNATLNRTAMFLFIFLAIGSADFLKYEGGPLYRNE